MLDILIRELNSGTIQLIAQKLGFETTQIQAVVQSLLPKATTALQSMMSQPDKMSALVTQVMTGSFAGYLDDPEKVGSDTAIELGANLLLQFFGNASEVQKITEAVAQETKIAGSELSKIIPALTSSVMAAVAKNAGSILMSSGSMGVTSNSQKPDNSAVTDLLGGLLSGAAKDGSLNIGALAASFLKK